MWRVILKLLAFFIPIVVITNWSISQIDVIPRKNFDSCRINQINNNLQEYNVVFVESSRFGRQIDTGLFDSLNAEAGFKSYSYAFDAAFAPTSLNLANSVLAQHSCNLKVLILELTPVEFTGELEPGFVATSINWYSLNDFLFLLQSGSDASIGFLNQVRLAFKRFYLFTYRILSIGEFWKRVALNKANCHSINNRANPLPEMKITPKLVRELNETKEADTTEKLKSYNLDLSSSSYLNEVNKLNEECRKRNIELITVVAPKLESVGITYVESLAKLLDQKSLIRLTNSDEYAQLPATALTSGPGHLNEKVIRPFTQYVSRGIQHILQQKTEEKNENGNL